MTMNHAAALGAPLGPRFRGVPQVRTPALKEEPLADLYRRHFTLERAKTEQQKRVAYNLRYRVLAEENNYLDPAEYPDAMEQDEYDDRAEHFTLRHNLSGDIAGTVVSFCPMPVRPGRSSSSFITAPCQTSTAAFRSCSRARCRASRCLALFAAV